MDGSRSDEWGVAVAPEHALRPDTLLAEARCLDPELASAAFGVNLEARRKAVRIAAF
jgi:hypothetical protein